MPDACATCAKQYSNPHASLSEKPLLPGRHLPCCDRSICVRCLNSNKRYETYCPYCQITTAPSPLPQGLKDPPAYSSLEPDKALATASRVRIDDATDGPPPYSAQPEKTRQDPVPDDVLHFVSPNDTPATLALAYGVPLEALRRKNGIFSDHLLQGRRTLLIPGEFYSGESLAPRPLEGEEEEARKQKVRRWMVASKCADYDIALLYLNKSEWNLDDAIQAYAEDEQWERDHPLEAQQRIKKGKASKEVGMRRFVGGS